MERPDSLQKSFKLHGLGWAGFADEFTGGSPGVSPHRDLVPARPSVAERGLAAANAAAAPAQQVR